MKSCHQKSEKVANDEYQIGFLCGFKLHFPKQIIKKFVNLEYVSKKIKKRNKKTGQNDIEVVRRFTL